MGIGCLGGPAAEAVEDTTPLTAVSADGRVATGATDVTPRPDFD